MKNHWDREQWEFIKNKYSKSYKELDKFFNLSSNSDCYGVHYPTVRSLYDFFDDKGIFINIEPINELGKRDIIEKNEFIKAFYLLEKFRL
jgi:hypothetical protein